MIGYRPDIVITTSCSNRCPYRSHRGWSGGCGHRGNRPGDCHCGGCGVDEEEEEEGGAGEDSLTGS